MRMELANYEKETINDVVRALVAVTDDEMRPAFDFFSGEDAVIDKQEMLMTVPMLGENLTERVRNSLQFSDSLLSQLLTQD